MGVRSGEVLDGMPRRREAEARRHREWIGPARSRSHGAGIVLVGVVRVEEERADAAEARCGEWDGMEAQAPLATAAATHPTASRLNAPLVSPTSPDVEGRAKLDVEAQAPSSPPPVQRAERCIELGVEA